MDNSIISKKLNYLSSELIKNKIFDSRIRFPDKNGNLSRILDTFGYSFLIQFNGNHRITKVSCLKDPDNELDFSENIWSPGKTKKIIKFMLSYIGKHPDYSFVLKNL